MEIKEILERNGESSKDVISLIKELQKPNPDKTMVQKLLGFINSATVIKDAIVLIGKISSPLL